MFSHPLDPPSVTAARQTELQHITRWIHEASAPWEEQRERLAWWHNQQQQLGVGGKVGRLAGAAGGLMHSVQVQLQMWQQRLVGAGYALKATR